MTGQRCPWRLAWRNLGGADIMLDCEREQHLPGSEQHEGRLLQAVVTWYQGDWRGYRGEFPGWCSITGCLAPKGHLGRCAK